MQQRLLSVIQRALIIGKDGLPKWCLVSFFTVTHNKNWITNNTSCTGHKSHRRPLIQLYARQLVIVLIACSFCFHLFYMQCSCHTRTTHSLRTERVSLYVSATVVCPTITVLRLGSLKLVTCFEYI